MLNTTQLSVLQLLYTLGRADHAVDLSVLATRLEMSCRATDEVLTTLERAGLLNADRVRLTLSGLAMAVAFPAVGRRCSVAA